MRAKATPRSTGRRQRSTDGSCGKLDVESGAATRITVDPDLPRVIGDDGLHDRKAKASPVLLCRVIGGEQSFSFLLVQALAGVGHVDPDNRTIATSHDSKRATARHRVDAIEEQVLDGAPQLLAVASYRAE